jgi:hypothetical protein
MKIVNGIPPRRSQPPWLSEHKRFLIAKAYYAFLRELEDRREGHTASALRVLLALFPELVLARFDLDEDCVTPPAAADDNIVYLR